MAMNGIKWLWIVLLGVAIGVMVAQLLSYFGKPPALTWLEKIDHYGKVVPRESVGSVKYIGVKKSNASAEMDSYVMTFTALSERFERQTDKRANEKKTAAWHKIFCTDKLKIIISQYDNSRVKVMVSGVVYSNAGVRVTATVCYLD
ncbi:hypothetical protein ABF236_000462 [Yersinia ruckeri]|nr:hypothetical protein [Yersinia ruckeri]